MAIKTKDKEHFRTSDNIVFYRHEKLLPWTEYALFSTFVGSHYFWAFSCLFFCYKSYRFRHVVINLFVRLDITLQWSPVA